MPDLLFGPVPHDEAVDFIKSKPITAGNAFNGLLPDLKARAFAISGIECANVLQSVRDRIADLPGGANWDDVKKDILADISPFIIDPNASPEHRDGQINAANRRAELLLRIHGFQAYSASAYQVMDAQRDVMPYWQYLSMEDEKVRPSHAALDKVVLPHDDPFWKLHYPPWDWSCRCQVVPISQPDHDEIAQADIKRAPDQRLILNDSQRAQANHGVIWRNAQTFNISPPSQHDDNGFVWSPDTLRLPLNQLEKRYDPPVWSAFQMWAKKQPLHPDQPTTVWQWLKGVKATPAPTPVPPPSSVNPIVSSPQPVKTVPPPLAPPPRTPQVVFDEIKKAVDVYKIERANLDAYWPTLKGVKISVVKQHFDQNNYMNGFGLTKRKTIKTCIDKIMALSDIARKALDNFSNTGKLADDQSNLSRLSNKIIQTEAVLRKWIHPSLYPKNPVKITTAHLASSSGAHYRPSYGDIEVNITSYNNGSLPEETIAHEIMHHIQDKNPKVMEREVLFRDRRTTGENPVTAHASLGGYQYYKDQWDTKGGDHYTGRIYGGGIGVHQFTEILSTGIERLLEDPIRFAHDDPDFCAEIIHILQTDWSKVP